MLGLESPISEIQFNTKDGRPCELLGASTVGGFLQADLAKVLAQRGFGVRTHAKLMATREKLRDIVAHG